jgi:hypothetical protein
VGRHHGSAGLAEASRPLDPPEHDERSDGYAAQLEGSLAPIPAELEAPIWEDAKMLAEWLGMREPLWPEAPARDVEQADA